MPQRISIVYICSLCEAETDQPGKMTAYQIGRPGKLLDLDVCTACAEVGPLRDLLERGLKPGKPAPTPALAHPAAKVVAEPATTASGKALCPECGELFTVNGLPLHRSKAHGVVSTYGAEMAARGKVGEYPCPECDFLAARPQGLGAHRRMRHATPGRKRVKK